jgi:hypothetical protein
MRVEIRFDKRDPPRGQVRLVNGEHDAAAAAPFVGWLGLLRALAEALARGR